MDYESIRYDVADRVATITLDRPDRLNALSRAMIDELRDAYARAEADPDAWLLVVTGAGRAFCTGADV
ncbi:MAG TPA: enoyl-CoA hydratase/isomerase family protein, partial [Acidimicrobiia bacterium]|nr:enoyl-CoA hydratase/isomerase family protein [Acidimicrobiia bacterium]